ELKVGVPFPTLVIEIIRATLSPGVAHEIVLAGATFDPEAALARGLVDEVVAPEALIERAGAIASDLAAVPGTSYRLSKERLRRPVREACERHGPAEDTATVAAWSSAGGLDAVRGYVSRPLGEGAEAWGGRSSCPKWIPTSAARRRCPAASTPIPICSRSRAIECSRRAGSSWPTSITSRFRDRCIRSRCSTAC